MNSSTLPVPRGIDCPTIMFSITPLRVVPYPKVKRGVEDL
jgi:hypothetical protein